MPNIFYTIFIFPIEQIIELIYVFAFRISRSPGISIIGISLAVSTLVLPVYLSAEKQQQAEREKQKQMKSKIDAIKAVFKGDKQYMLLSAFYRQNNYHPLYALRNSIDLFIQIPFFIAAYHFLNNLTLLNGRTFLFIKNLGYSDRLFFGINILPILMTFINIISGIIYTKGFPKKDKIQLFLMAFLFLILLYNSPSALVLYWTANNIYSLLKNLLQKSNKSWKIIKIIILFCSIIISIYLILFHRGAFKRRFILVCLLLIISLLPFFKINIEFLKRIFKLQIKKNTVFRIFLLSTIALLLLVGLYVPSSLISSSVSEFSFLKPFSSPFPYIFFTFLQTFGLFFWLVCIYLLFNRKIRLFMTFTVTIVLFLFSLNVFTFNADYGFMTPDLLFNNFKNLSLNQIFLNLFLLSILFSVITFLILKHNKLLISLQSIIIVSLLCLCILNIIKINGKYIDDSVIQSTNFEKIYSFSKSENNILVIDLDTAISGYIPYIFSEKPELLKAFSGFTFYPNTISYGSHTIVGTPGIFGGYYYTPMEIQKRSNELFWTKYHESMQVLPIIFSNNNYKVKVIDQPEMDYSLYNNFENITAEKNVGKYTNYYLNNINDFSYKNYYDILYTNLVRFSFFKCSPLFLHKIIYDEGKYLSLLKFKFDSTNYNYRTIDTYTSLYFLSNITEINETNEKYCNIFVNELPHDPAFFELPDYIPSKNIIVTDNNLFSDEPQYHVNMASIILLAKWFNFLKENNVYDNTRIAIVSDHGTNLTKPPPEYIDLPNNNKLENYAALLMFKDFNSSFDFKIDYCFMTNADVPQLITKDIIENITNPFNGKELLKQKNNGVTITCSELWNLDRLLPNSYNIKPNEWLHVQENIFNPDNWKPVTFEY